MTAPPPPIPPVPTNQPAVGSPDWADLMVRTVLPPQAGDIVRQCVVAGSDQFVSQDRARRLYCTLVMGSGMEGWAARMVWDCISAILKPLEDDIPF